MMPIPTPVNEQLLTSTNDFQEFDQLELWEQQAISWRADGYTPKYIEDQLALLSVKLSARVISQYFSKNGKWNKYFRQQKRTKEKENRINEIEIQKLFRGASKEAFLQVRELMRDGNLSAALQVLDRAGFQVVQKVEDVSDTEKIDKIARRIDELSRPKPS